MLLCTDTDDLMLIKLLNYKLNRIELGDCNVIKIDTESLGQSLCCVRTWTLPGLKQV